MAHDVLVWRIDTSYTGSWAGSGGGSPYTISSGQYLHIQLEDSTAVITVQLTNSSTEGASVITTLTEGPNLFFGYDGAATLLTVSPYYQFCDGTTLRMIGTNNLFPYATLSFNEGALECVIAPTCDLEINSIYTVVPTTGPADADGEITVSATSSNGTIKYSLDEDFDYTTEGQTSPTFTGLLPNTYTIYAKDAVGCQDDIDITVPVTTVYGVKYRRTFIDSKVISGRSHRVDILERAYDGEITTMCVGGDPVHIRWNGDPNDPSKPIIPVEYSLQIKKETAGQYADLFTQDDRLFKIEHYVDSVLYWSGFIVPEFLSEPFIFEPYDIDVTAVDGLQELQKKDFRDESDNKYVGEIKQIVIIAEILKKCGLNLHINAGINLFAKYDIDETIPIMDETDPTHDPLDLAYMDMRIFDNNNCYEVLQRILEPYRAQIFQAEGQWWIVRLSDAVGSFEYREYDENGVYVDDDTINPVQNLDFPSQNNVGFWVSRSQWLYHMRNYGYFNITHDAGRDNNLIDEGRFEPEDVIYLGSGNSTFKNWNFFLAQNGVKYGFEYVKNGESTGAALVSFRSAGSTPQADNKLYSITVPLSRFSGGYLKLRFQYQIRPNYTDLPYIRLGWSVKVFDSVDSIYMSPAFPPDFSRLSNSEEIINELYVTQFGSFQTLECLSLGMFTTTGEMDQMYATITFYMHNHYSRDFDDITELKAFSISDKEIKSGRHVYVIDDSDNQLTHEYISEANIEGESLPDLVEPDDYAADYLWRKGKSFRVPSGTADNTSLVADFLIDTTSLEIFPQSVVNGQTVYIEPPKEVIYEQEVSKLIQSNLEKTMYLGDMPIFDDTNADIVHYNNERLIYRGWLRNADGEPTYRWKRKGVDEYKKLLQILLEDYRDQFSTPKRKMAGTFTSDILWSFLNAVEEQFEGSRYRFMTMDFDCRRAEYTVEMVQVEVGSGGEPPVEVGAFDSEEFTEEYDI